MGRSEQIEGMNQLCRSYGFKKLDIPVFIFQSRFSASSLEWTYQQLRLFQLLYVCEEGKATIEGIITNPQKGMLKGTTYKANVDVDWLKEATIETLKKEISFTLGAFYHMRKIMLENGVDIENLKPDDITTLLELFNELKAYFKFTEIAIKGWHLHDLYEMLSESDFFPRDCAERKKYSFLYDYCVLIEKANNIGEGFSGNIGREKYTQVRNWINAYKNQKPTMNIE